MSFIIFAPNDCAHRHKLNANDKKLLLSALVVYLHEFMSWEMLKRKRRLFCWVTFLAIYFFTGPILDLAWLISTSPQLHHKLDLRTL